MQLGGFVLAHRPIACLGTKRPSALTLSPSQRRQRFDQRRQRAADARVVAASSLTVTSVAAVLDSARSSTGHPFWVRFSRANPRWIPFTAVVAVIGVLVAWWRKQQQKKFLSTAYTTLGVQDKIATFYDDRSALWEDVWGEHMHHGYYGVDGLEKRKDDVQAQVDMIDTLLSFGGLRESSDSGTPQRILDIGCGIGGATRHLARRFPSAVVEGVTLSPFQVKRGNELSQQSGLETRAILRVADALKLPYEDETFDLVWSLESAEHMPDKRKFLEEGYRVLRRGGTFVMLAWCHREVPPSLTIEEQYILRSIYQEYAIPRMCPPSEFQTEAIRAGFRQVIAEDWSRSVEPFWAAVARSAFTTKGWNGLKRGGWKLIRSALAIRHMMAGFRRNTIVLNALRATKPTTAEQEQEQLQAPDC
eukprot:CAMPEP_0184681928 /NCGR_PEP_ID=MMETSP0312-20130426/4905_1 /TAXON_ID=31354 /ORGANISM="Compsopogon coeruleus, Strain SAG 36.94" /LENGTH=417 /DNA_ID=CAMNT_0027133065 /DNA_START=843 /DNA_END=2096 /DNA_ORIENTATION=-